MNIKISKLILKNFKGTKSLVADFKGVNAAIKGDNGVGKSTICDAFSWILFNKNSAGSKDFNIKTLDKNNNVIHGLDHEVTAILLVDKKEITLKKSYKETWTKRRGEAEKTMTGHTTDYFLNEVPAKKSEYESYISAIVDEKIFKLITSPLEFNNLPWKEKRTSLLEIVGDVSDENVITSSDKLKRLSGLLGDRKLEDFKKLISSKKKLLNTEIKSIPYRVDELVSSVDISGTDFTEKEKNIKNLETEITNIDFKVMDQSSMYKASNLINSKIYEIKNKLRIIETDARTNADAPMIENQKNITTHISKISKLNYALEDANHRLERIKDLIVNKKNDKQTLIDKWMQKRDETLDFSEREFSCPTCKRDYDEDKAESLKEEMLQNFADAKAIRLGEISKEGKALKSSIETNEENVITITKDIKNTQSSIKVLETELEAIDHVEAANYEFIKSSEYLTLETQIKELEASIKEPNTEYLDELKVEKRTKEKEIDKFKAEINQKAQFVKNQIRITELQEREKELGSMIADLEGQEFLCESFIRTKVDMLEDKINSKFKNVGFKMFKEQVNGGLEEICEILVAGVPFNEANSSGKINAGIDIINTLCEHYNVTAPIFVDNAEGINNFIDCEAQMIKLYVTHDKKLIIESEAI